MKTPQEIRHEEHMAGVRAVQRRSAYERVMRAIASYEVLGDHLEDYERGNLDHLRELRDTLHREMIEHGQIEDVIE